MTEENICPKHNIPLKLRRNVKTGDVALACPYCDVEEQRKKHGREDANQAAFRVVREATKE
jgi:hypothetical protein